MSGVTGKLYVGRIVRAEGPVVVLIHGEDIIELQPDAARNIAGLLEDAADLVDVQKARPQ